VLSLDKVSLFVGKGDHVRPLLGDISVNYPRGHFAAVIGPSGCGKSTLLKLIAGVAHGEEEGDVSWNGRDLGKHDFSPSEIGYVPQFSIAHEELTVWESVEFAVRLRVGRLRRRGVRNRTIEALENVGLSDLSDRPVQVLSGGQRRRLSLAMEIVSAPVILLADEVTSGLDPNAEEEITALLGNIAHESNRLVLCVTHSLRHLELFDSVTVLYNGVIAYYGSPQYLDHYFQVDDTANVYRQLTAREPTEWQRSWDKHRDQFEKELMSHAMEVRQIGGEWFAEASAEVAANAPADEPPSESPDEPGTEVTDADQPDAPEATGAPAEEEEAAYYEAPVVKPATPRPNAVAQWYALVDRRLRIFLRSRAQLILQIGLIFGFPLIVAVFAWNGLPQIRSLSMDLDLDVVSQLVEARDFLIQATKVGSLVSGIVMFQVILLTLMGANNSGREIASERDIFEKEKLAGLRCSSYIASKAVFLAFLVLAQSLWMGLFVHYICGLPGDLVVQLGFLILANAAMTAVCLGISSWMDTPEQASLVSIYLVGFQLPLSGAVLALPDWLGWIARPFIAAYWSWSGVLQSLRDESYYHVIQSVIQTGLANEALCFFVLILHVIAGLIAAYAGAHHLRWK